MMDDESELPHHDGAESEHIAEAPAPEVPSRPTDLPEKFWDAEAGTVRTEALLKSYVELERRLGRSIALPADGDDESWTRLFDTLGRPASPEGYEIQPAHPILAVDEEVTKAFYEAGFSQKQAQVVFDLAATRLVPALEGAMADLNSQKEQARLRDHFGGKERWAAVSDQIRRWAASHLEPEVSETLSGSYDGVVALFEMMRRQEPELIGDGGSAAGGPSEAQLNAMVADPRYWRHRDPEFVSRVTDGFRRLYQD